MNTPEAYVIIESLGNARRGTSKAGNSYVMGEGFIHLANCPYPQKFDYFCQSDEDVLKNGVWQVPVSYEVREGRLDFRLNTKEARALVTKQPATAPAPQSK